MVPIGRCSALSCAVTCTSPRANPASGATKRITVPAWPQSIVPPPASGQRGDQTRSSPYRPARAPLDPDAEGAQGIDHPRGVVGVQRRDEAARTVGEGGEDQLAIRQRFGARERSPSPAADRPPSARATRPARGRCRILGNTVRLSSGSTLLNPADNPQKWSRMIATLDRPDVDDLAELVRGVGPLRRRLARDERRGRRPTAAQTHARSSRSRRCPSWTSCTPRRCA